MSTAPPATADVPLPEPAAWQVRQADYGLWESTYWEECSEWEAKNCVAAADLRQLYAADQVRAHAADQVRAHAADQVRAHAAAVSAAKDAEIAQLRTELLKLLADNAALRVRVRALEDARPEPDCRTCKHMMHRHFRITCGAEPCTNGNRYQELPPVRLWRTT